MFIISVSLHLDDQVNVVPWEAEVKRSKLNQGASMPTIRLFGTHLAQKLDEK